MEAIDWFSILLAALVVLSHSQDMLVNGGDIAYL